MSLQNVLEAARDHYVKFFVAARDRQLIQNPQTVAELLISINTDELKYPYRYLRVDLLSKDAEGTPKPIELRIDAEPVEGRGFNFGTFVVEAYPFSWCAVQLLLGSEPTNMRQLEGWMTRWLDVEDKKTPGPSGESLSVHSFSPIQKIEQGWVLRADFGTAPADALMELIELLVGQGVRRIAIQ